MMKRFKLEVGYHSVTRV